jgi:hypothetical protein
VLITGGVGSKSDLFNALRQTFKCFIENP